MRSDVIVVIVFILCFFFTSCIDAVVRVLIVLCFVMKDVLILDSG